MPFSKSQLIIIGAGVLVFLFVVLLFLGIVPGLRSNQTPEISGSLAVWGVADAPAAMEPLIAEYNAIYPNIAVTYTQLNEATYESDVTNALAAGRGPDIFMIRNTWAPKHADKLSALTAAQFPVSRLETVFPRVVGSDLAFNASTTFGFPLYLDTLVLYYNRDLFDNAGLAHPPATWEELGQMVPRLRSIDATQRIQRAAIALGGSAASVSRVSDILSLMMLQDGAPMVSSDQRDARFAVDGAAAFARYTDFANPASPLYTWNDAMGSELDAFAAGRVAMIIGFQADAARISEKNPFLRFSASPMLQLAGRDPVNYPSYWAFAVPATGRNVGLAWDFAATTALNDGLISAYLAAAGRTPALRTLIAQLVDNPDTGFAARQALTARSWLQPDALAVDAIFSNAVSAVLSGRLSRDNALRAAEEEITGLLRKLTASEL